MRSGARRVEWYQEHGPQEAGFKNEEEPHSWEPAESSRREVGSSRFAREDLGDPAVADRFIDELIDAVTSATPIGPEACYISSNLRRHLEFRAADMHGVEPRLEPATEEVRGRLDDAGILAEGLEAAMGQLIAVSGIYKRLAAREIMRSLELLREHLRLAREPELELAQRAHWEDLGGSG